MTSPARLHRNGSRNNNPNHGWLVLLMTTALLLSSSSSTSLAFQQPRVPQRPSRTLPNRVAAAQVEQETAVQPLSSNHRRQQQPQPSQQQRRRPTLTSLDSSPPRHRESSSSSSGVMAAIPKQSPPPARTPPSSSEDALTEELKRLVQASATTTEAPVVTEPPKPRKRAIPAFRSGRGRPRKSTAAAATSVISPIGGRVAATPSPYDDSPYVTLTQSSTTTSTTEEARETTNDKQGNNRKTLNYPQQNQHSGGTKDIQRYYKTDLLSVPEEYLLGAQIQFMVACEQVHEGLSVHLGRLPTLGEWAAACGYTDSDAQLRLTPADEQLRPAGSHEMFQQVDPTLFVGSGQVGEAGPGRGRGRQKKIPHKRLKDRRKDSLFPANPLKRTPHPGPDGQRPHATIEPIRIDASPVNRGTTRDFLNMMEQGHEAKQTMVQSNMRLVVSIARKYMNVGVSLHDLVQEGSLGLSRAAEKFDPLKGFKFSTYASWWIQQAVFRSIAYQSRTIRLPVHIHNMLNRIHRVRNGLTSELSRHPTNEEMAKQLGMSLPKYNKLLRLTKRSISLDMPKYKSNPKDLGHEGDDMIVDTVDASSVSSTLLDDSAPEKLVDHDLFLDDLKDMLQILSPEERLVLCARYGLSDGITRTVTDVAAQMKQSKAWVRSQECRALRKLRRPWYEKKLKEHESSLGS
eukprot:CAMPEP_0172442958 /NCGR_PEP_ID=MMETSP1065-20121228/3285_1 /TAXON_ID=265537 /ORGANISM="Amphiprora paludosa, Strain CCMP125" /LENGTH=683 /DNA_ID=CAMNT_0013193007 /DNA_START=171 /DNA_END=2222 /DNA_ORIENTATION=+